MNCGSSKTIVVEPDSFRTHSEGCTDRAKTEDYYDFIEEMGVYGTMHDVLNAAMWRGPLEEEEASSP